MIFQVGSEIFTHKPGANSDRDSNIEVGVEGKNETPATPRQQDVRQGDLAGPLAYETPVILRTKRRAPSIVEVDDTEAENSEIERKVAIMKRKKAMSVSL